MIKRQGDSARRLVIVEDEHLLAEDLASRLTDLGYEVAAVASSGEAGVEVTERLRPDLVLMDINLRGRIDGIAAAEKLRDRWEVPVIFLTGNADDVTFERAKAVCPLGYVLKPFDVRQLQIVLEVALARHAAEVAVRQAAELHAAMLLAGSVAHEINNPLMVVKGILDLLQRRCSAGSVERRYVDLGQQAATRISDAIQQLANITHLEIAPSTRNVPPMLDLKRSSEPT